MGRRWFSISQWTNRIFINGMCETKEERRQIRLWNHWWTFRNWYWIGKRMDEIRPSSFSIYSNCQQVVDFMQSKRKLNIRTMITQNHADFIIAVMVRDFGSNRCPITAIINKSARIRSNRFKHFSISLSERSLCDVPLFCVGWSRRGFSLVRCIL